MSNQEKFVDQINEALDDIEYIEDFYVDDTDDAEVIELVIRGRLRKDCGTNTITRKDDPISDYDRAMRGVS